MLVSQRRDLTATRRFVTRALRHGTHLTDVTTDRVPAYPRALDDLADSCRIPLIPEPQPHRDNKINDSGEDHQGGIDEPVLPVNDQD